LEINFSKQCFKKVYSLRHSEFGHICIMTAVNQEEGGGGEEEEIQF
jgi:hypothetical protein